MDQTKIKVDRNLSGIQYLMSRPDVQAINPKPETPDSGFYVCRSIMRDNIAVISICLSANVYVFAADGKEQYTRRDYQGRGTTFEMALFDLSAQIIKNLSDNEWIDTEGLPIVENHGKKPVMERGRNDKGICANEPDTSEHAVNGAHGNEQKGMETRSNGTGRRGKNAGGNSKRNGQRTNGYRGN